MRTNGKSKNLAFGPMAAHVYETPGTYKAVLSVFDGDEVRTIEQEIVVDDPDVVFSDAKTTCISTVGNFEGCPEGANTVQSDNVPESVGTCLQGDEASRCLLRRGESFARNERINIEKSAPVLISTFGDPNDANPEFHFNGAGVRLGEGVQDARIVGLHFVGQASSDARVFVAARRFDNFLVLNTTAEAKTLHSGLNFPNSILEFVGDELHDGLFFVENDWRELGFGAGGNIVAIASKRIAILGNTLLDSTSGELGHRFCGRRRRNWGLAAPDRLHVQ